MLLMRAVAGFGRDQDMQTFPLSAAILLLVAGCSEVPSSASRSDTALSNSEAPSAQRGAKSPLAAPADRIAVAVDDDGLRLIDEQSGSARPVPFGSKEADAIATLEVLLGRPERSRNEECGAGAIDFAIFGGLALHFQQGQLVGWALSAAPDSDIGTMNGIAIGTTRRQLEQAYPRFAIVPESTLGTEFTTGEAGAGISGLLDGDSPTAKVTNLWAGTDCAFR